MKTISQILQTWAKNVPESAALPDDLKMKLAQTVADVVAELPLEERPPEARRAIWIDSINGTEQYTGWAWKTVSFSNTEDLKRMNYVFLADSPSGRLPKESPAWVYEDDLVFMTTESNPPKMPLSERLKGVKLTDSGTEGTRRRY